MNTLQLRKGITAVGAVVGFVAPVLMMGNGYNDTLLAVTSMFGVVAIALIMGQWTRN